MRRSASSGVVPVASQKAIAVGSWFIRKSSMPARKPGSLMAWRTWAGSTPVNARKRAEHVRLVCQPAENGDRCFLRVGRPIVWKS